MTNAQAYKKAKNEYGTKEAYICHSVTFTGDCKKPMISYTVASFANGFSNKLTHHGCGKSWEEAFKNVVEQ